MLYARRLEEMAIADTRTCVTIGNFDGVHMGHQRLISRVRDEARRLGLSSVVITFDPHPLHFFSGKKSPALLTTPACKRKLIEDLHVDALLCLEFTRELANMSPEVFVQNILVRGLSAREVFIGYDYAFGKGRGGSYELLQQLGKNWDFGVERLDPVRVDGETVSSSRIRSLIQSGDMLAARKLLGRPFCVSGRVTHGKERGRALGFPTANLDTGGQLLPATGTYCCLTELNGVRRQAVANVGFNPTFGDTALSVEVHILDFCADIYDQNLTVQFAQRLRGERKFSSVDELTVQIGNDVAQARNLLPTL